MAGPSGTQRVYSNSVFAERGTVIQGDVTVGGNININNFTGIRPFAKKLHRACLGSAGGFDQLQNEIAFLLVLLETTEDNAKEQHFDADSQPKLQGVSQGCYKVLGDLENLKNHYDGLNTQAQVTWDRMGWKADELSDIRMRLTSYIGMLNAFNTNIVNSSQTRVESLLNKFIAEVRAGQREGSVVSTRTVDSLSVTEREAWRLLRKELESIGITPTLFTQHKTFIVVTLQKAIADGSFDDIMDRLGISSRSGERRNVATRSPTETTQNQFVGLPLSEKPQDDIRGMPNKGFSWMARLLYSITGGTNALFAAATDGDVDRVKSLLVKGAAVNKETSMRETALMMAARNGHETVVQLLIEKGAAVDREMLMKETALTMAAGNGHATVVQLLIEKGAAVDQETLRGETALMMAARNGHETVVQLLIGKGAAVDNETLGWETALMRAARNGHETALQLLIENGAAAEKQAFGRETALMMAARNGHETVVQVLIEKGAAVDKKRLGWETALMMAARNGHKTVVQLLAEKEAVVNNQDIWIDTDDEGGWE